MDPRIFANLNLTPPPQGSPMNGDTVSSQLGKIGLSVDPTIHPPLPSASPENPSVVEKALNSLGLSSNVTKFEDPVDTRVMSQSEVDAMMASGSIPFKQPLPPTIELDKPDTYQSGPTQQQKTQPIAPHTVGSSPQKSAPLPTTQGKTTAAKETPWYKAGFHDDQSGIKPETKALLEESRAREEKAITDEGTNQAVSAHLRGEALHQHARDLEQVHVERLVLQDQRDRFAKQGVDELRAKNAEIVNTKIDPSRYLEGGGHTAQNILTGIAMVVGGIIGKDGMSTGLRMMESAINRDVQAQMADLQTKKEGLKTSQNLYAEMLERYNDPILAKDAQVNYLRHQTDLKLQEIAEQTNSQTAKNNIEKARAELQKNIFETNAAMEQRTFVSKQQEFMTTRQLAAGAASAAAKAPGSMQNIMKNQEDLRDRYIPELGGFAAKGQVKDVQEAMFGATRMKNALNELKTITDTDPRWRTNGAYRNKIEELAKTISGSSSAMYKQGTIGEAEHERNTEIANRFLTLNPYSAWGAAETLDDAISRANEYPAIIQQVYPIEKGTVTQMQNPQTGITTNIYVPTGGFASEGGPVSGQGSKR